MKKIIYIATIGITLLTTSCDDFLDRQVPQGIVTGDQIASPEYVDNLVISAYAIWRQVMISTLPSLSGIMMYVPTIAIKAVREQKTAVCSTHWKYPKVSIPPTGISMIYGKDCINASPVPIQLCNHSTKWMKRPIR